MSELLLSDLGRSPFSATRRKKEIACECRGGQVKWSTTTTSPDKSLIGLMCWVLFVLFLETGGEKKSLKISGEVY